MILKLEDQSPLYLIQKPLNSRQRLLLAYDLLLMSMYSMFANVMGRCDYWN